MSRRTRESHALASQYALQLGEHSVVHDIMGARLDGNTIAQLMLGDDLWKHVSDKVPALFIDDQAHHWMTIHPHTLIVEEEGMGDIPFNRTNLSGVAMVTYPLANSQHLSEQFTRIESLLGQEGVLLILEQSGSEHDPDWRRSVLHQHKLVGVDVSARDGYLLWHGREKKAAVRNPHDYIERYAHDHEEWRQNYFPVQFARLLTYFRSVGFEVSNFHEIEKRLRNSKMPHADFELLKQGLGVELVDRRCGECTHHIPLKGSPTVRHCTNESAHETELTDNDLWHDKVLYERILSINKTRELIETPTNESILSHQCPDCFSNIRQQTEYLGRSPVGDLYYVHRYCMGGEIEEESIGFVTPDV